MFEFSLFPPQASTHAINVDWIYLCLVGITIFFCLLITIIIAVFAVRYRNSVEVDRSNPLTHSTFLEVTWTVIPILICIPLFYRGAQLFFEGNSPPPDAMEIYVVGKQWMWKIEHPAGLQEINELHVPMGRPVKLIMTSQDVVHDFFIPAFRVKMDVLPGRFTSLWFEAILEGTYHLFCAEYCGTEHAGMTGKVYVMKPADYQQWLSGGIVGEDMVTAGARLFDKHGCKTCHMNPDLQRGPKLVALPGSVVRLKSGEALVADENYIRESILDPKQKIVEGYEAIMPTYEGLLTETEVMQIIEYLKILEEAQGAKNPGTAGVPGGSGSDRSAVKADPAETTLETSDE